ncbi:MAG: hypothetical protein WCG27_03665 [Pseudomonadota bacterium]
MKISLVMLFLGTLLFAFPAMAWKRSSVDQDGWAHRHLKSKEGISITIDYQYIDRPIITDRTRYAGVNLATSVWFNVTAPEAKNVSVEVTFYEQSYIWHSSTEPAIIRSHDHYDRTINLQKNETGFTGMTQTLVVERFSSASNLGYFVYQKIRIMVDGKPLIDPISGTDQFMVLLIDKQ